MKTTHYVCRTKNPDWEVSTELLVADYTKVNLANCTSWTYIKVCKHDIPNTLYLVTMHTCMYYINYVEHILVAVLGLSSLRGWGSGDWLYICKSPCKVHVHGINVKENTIMMYYETWCYTCSLIGYVTTLSILPGLVVKSLIILCYAYR